MSTRDPFDRAHFDRDHFETERPNPATLALDTLSTAAAFDAMNAEDAHVHAAVARA